MVTDELQPPVGGLIQAHQLPKGNISAPSDHKFLFGDAMDPPSQHNQLAAAIFEQQQEGSSIVGGFSYAELLLVVVLISLILISIVGNCLVCVAIFTDRRLRKLGNAFIVSLAIADLFVSCLVMTFALCNDLMNYWIFGDWFCDIWISFDIMCCTASILNLCAISLDRFIHIKDCLLYNQWMTRKVAISAVIIIWFISVLVSIVPINLGWHKPSEQFGQLRAPESSSPEGGSGLARTLPARPSSLGRRDASAELTADKSGRDKGEQLLAIIQRAASDAWPPAGGTYAAGGDNQERNIGNRLAPGDKLNYWQDEKGARLGPIESQSSGRNDLRRTPAGGASGAAPPTANSSTNTLGPDFVSAHDNNSSGRRGYEPAHKAARGPIRTNGRPAPGATTSGPKMNSQVVGARAFGRDDDQPARRSQFNQVESNPRDGFRTRLVRKKNKYNNSNNNGPDNESPGSGPHGPGEGVAMPDFASRARRSRSASAPSGSLPLLPSADQSPGRHQPSPPAGPNHQHQHRDQDQEHEPGQRPLPQCMLTLTPTYAIVSSAISFYIPCIIMLGLYSKLFVCARRHVRNIRATSKAPHPIGPASVAKRQQVGASLSSNNSEPVGGENQSPGCTTACQLASQRPTSGIHLPAQCQRGRKRTAREELGAGPGQLGWRNPVRTWIKFGRKLGGRPRDEADEIACGENEGPHCGERRADNGGNCGMDPAGGRGGGGGGEPGEQNGSSHNNYERTSRSSEMAKLSATDADQSAQSPDKSTSLLANICASQTPEAGAKPEAQGQQQQKTDWREDDPFLSNQQQQQQQQQQLANQSNLTIGSLGCESLSRQTTCNSMRSITFRLNWSSMAKQGQQFGSSSASANQQEKTSQLATHKAAITLGIIMGTFLFCWVPFFCLNIIKAFCVDCIPSSVFRFFTWLGYANSALNPIIYGIHNSEFRCAFNRIFFKHLSIKNGRQYLNRRFSYDLRHHQSQQNHSTTTTSNNRSRQRHKASNNGRKGSIRIMAIKDNDNNNNSEISGKQQFSQSDTLT